MVALRMQLCDIRELPRTAQRRQAVWVWVFRFAGGFEFSTACGRRIKVYERQLELALHKAAEELAAA